MQLSSLQHAFCISNLTIPLLQAGPGDVHCKALKSESKPRLKARPGTYIQQQSNAAAELFTAVHGTLTYSCTVRAQFGKSSMQQHFLFMISMPISPCCF